MQGARLQRRHALTGSTEYPNYSGRPDRSLPRCRGRDPADASVLFAIANEEPGSEEWESALQVAASEGGLLITPVAFAECSPPFDSPDALLRHPGSLGIRYFPNLKLLQPACAGDVTG